MLDYRTPAPGSGNGAGDVCDSTRTAMAGVIALISGMDRSKKTLKYSLNIYDDKLNKIKTIGFLSRNEQRGKKRINALDWGFPKFRVYDNRVYCEELDNKKKLI